MPEEQIFPPLTVADAENIVCDLQRGLDAHYAWNRRFQAMLVCRIRPGRTDLAVDGYLRDEFGRWYGHERHDHLKRHPDFEPLGELHRQVHAGARHLALIIAKGAKVAPVKFHAFQRDVDRFRDRVTSILDDARELLRFSDPLTGIATRFAMLPQLDQERERVARTGEPSSIGMLDLDHFKQINDTYGHQAGDTVLHEVAQYLLKNVRRYDQVCRYGGEEFVVLLPATDPRKAKQVLDRLRRGMKRKRIDIGDGQTISVSASFGIASLNPVEPIMATIDHADQAMYEAKQAGRNRVRIWNGDDNKS